jgi:hypothetical protein
MLKERLVQVKLSATVDKNLTEDLKNHEHFAHKLQWAKEFVKGRDLLKEIEEVKKREKIIDHN